jgi:hypothetical protein
MADMQSSVWHFSSFCVLILAFRSWIQGNPELGFGFKALVCHDGVRFLSLHEGAKNHLHKIGIRHDLQRLRHR